MMSKSLPDLVIVLGDHFTIDGYRVLILVQLQQVERRELQDDDDQRYTHARTHVRERGTREKGEERDERVGGGSRKPVWQWWCQRQVGGATKAHVRCRLAVPWPGDAGADGPMA